MKRIGQIEMTMLALLAGTLLPICAHSAPFQSDPQAASKAFSAKGVTLTVRDGAGFARQAEPVTSGIPLPEGLIQKPDGLILVVANGKTVPCQATPLARWPNDNSIKWLLLDFQADVPAKGESTYTLKEGTHGDLIEDPVTVEDVASGLRMSAGALQLEVWTNAPGLVHAVRWKGHASVTPEHPVQTELKDPGGRMWRASTPTRLTVETRGPMRSTILIQGQYITDSGESLLQGKVGYDLRLTAYAGKPLVKMDFTLKNTGSLGRKSDWLYARSLRLDIPLHEDASHSIAFSSGKLELGSNRWAGATQWYKYPAVNAIGWRYGSSSNRYARSQFDVEREAKAGITSKVDGFYYLADNGRQYASGTLLEGWCRTESGAELAIGRFRENHPIGIEYRAGVLSAVLWPDNGFWPRTVSASLDPAYQFEGSRFKTYEFYFQPDASGETGAAAHTRQSDQPLFARADTAWYPATGTVWPLAPVGIRSSNVQAQEAIVRYDRLQQAKVHVEMADGYQPVGTSVTASQRPKSGTATVEVPEGATPEDEEALIEKAVNMAIQDFKKKEDVRASILSLREALPDVYLGFMNMGDLIWSHGYCSLFYDWPYGMQIQFLRFGDPAMWSIARDMARHRATIDRGEGWQQYEKGYHGDLDRISLSRYKRTGYHLHPSHTWCTGLYLYWAMTGDSLAREAAEMNVHAYRNLMAGAFKKGDATLTSMEIRVPGWAIEALLSSYEYTGNKADLDLAIETFTRTLLAMETKNGSKGHLAKDGHQPAQMIAYILQPVIRLHRLTQKPEVLAFLQRVLDWHMKEGFLGGRTSKAGYDRIMFIDDWDAAKETSGDVLSASPIWGFMFADGYAYLHKTKGKAAYLDFSRQVFRDTLFYYGESGRTVDPRQRTPLGFLFRGSTDGMGAKAHAFSAVYDQVYLLLENELSGK